MRNVLYVLLGVMAGFVLAGVLVFVSRSPTGSPITLQPAPTKSQIAVDVIGAVPRPGLYDFSEGARVQDAINAAGGLLANANSDALNLAALLADGQQLNIPYKDGSQAANTPSALDLPSSTQNVPSSTSASDLININTANLDALDSLPGIGPTTAQKIIDYRNSNGPFATIEDILNVSGIGPATFDEIKNLITT
jgi:competence protein ComEA